MSNTTHTQFLLPSLHSLSLSPDEVGDTAIELDDDYSTYFPCPSSRLKKQAIQSPDPRPAVSPKSDPITISLPSTSNQTLNQSRPPSFPQTLALSPDDEEDTPLEDYNTYFPPTPGVPFEQDTFHWDGVTYVILDATQDPTVTPLPTILHKRH
jgi:hypothetical protein